MNDVNEIKSEGDNNWFKQLLHKRLSKRTHNIEIFTNEILNEINNKAKKRKTIYPKENTSDDDDSYKKMNHERNLRKMDD